MIACGSLFCADVKLSPLLIKGKKQLNKAQGDLYLQLSRVRIHVERVIGVVRHDLTVNRSVMYTF